VLDTGALITAEAAAMLQALHSRSVHGIDAHLMKLAQKGAAQFMDTYYIGYGDKSIGDCGTATVFIEGVSMLAAKAIQDSQLYNGQESSTRYVDFSTQPFISPDESASELSESLRTFHTEGLATMKEELMDRHPRGEEDEKKWKKAINARAFDIMRSFLPAGMATNLAWHTTLRHAADHLLRLRNHPLDEVRAIALTIEEALNTMYPNSFKQKRYEATEQYVSEWMKESYYFDLNTQNTSEPISFFSGVRVERDGIDRNLLARYAPILSNRPIKAELPRFLAECGSIRFLFFLDFGSFRDLQRHRAVTQRMPLLTNSWEFAPWYLDQMPQELRKKALSVLQKQRAALNKLSIAPVYRQYYIPMGYSVPCRLTGDLPGLTWLVELRSGISVHPTLRRVAQEIGVLLLETFGLTLYIDRSEDRFDIKRGEHDIVEK